MPRTLAVALMPGACPPRSRSRPTSRSSVRSRPSYFPLKNVWVVALPFEGWLGGDRCGEARDPEGVFGVPLSHSWRNWRPTWVVGAAGPTGRQESGVSTVRRGALFARTHAAHMRRSLSLLRRNGRAPHRRWRQHAQARREGHTHRRDHHLRSPCRPCSDNLRDPDPCDPRRQERKPLTRRGVHDPRLHPPDAQQERRVRSPDHPRRPAAPRSPPPSSTPRCLLVLEVPDVVTHPGPATLRQTECALQFGAAGEHGHPVALVPRGHRPL